MAQDCTEPLNLAVICKIHILLHKQSGDETREVCEKNFYISKLNLNDCSVFRASKQFQFPTVSKQLYAKS